MGSILGKSRTGMVGPRGASTMARVRTNAGVYTMGFYALLRRRDRAGPNDSGPDATGGRIGPASLP